MTPCDMLVFSDAPDGVSAPMESSMKLVSWGASKEASCQLVSLFSLLPESTVAACAQAYRPRIVVIDVPWEVTRQQLALSAAFSARLRIVRQAAPQAVIVVAVPWGKPFAQTPPWFSDVDLISLSGVDCADPLSAILAGGQPPADQYYAADNANISQIQVPLGAGYQCVSFELEPWACCMMCSTCRVEPGCTRLQLPWRAVGVMPARQAALAALVAELAECGGGYISIDDQNIAQPEKLAILRALHAQYPTVTWVLAMNNLSLPEFSAGQLLSAGVAGLHVFAPQWRAVQPQLYNLRAALVDGFLELVVPFGAPDDSRQAMSDFTAWVCDTAQAGLVDNYQAMPRAVPHASRAGASGDYRFPYPGRCSAPGQPYWETDMWDSDNLLQSCDEATQQFRRAHPAMARLRYLHRALLLRNYGITLKQLRRQAPSLNLEGIAEAVTASISRAALEGAACLL